MIFLAARVLHQRVVACFDFFVGRLVVLQEVFDQRAQHDGLLGNRDLRLDVRTRRDATASRFFHQDFTVDQLFAHGGLQLRRILLTLMDELIDERIDTCFRNRCAVHDGDILCKRRRSRKSG